MKITVNRIKSNEDETLSLVYVDNKFICFGLEDEYRSVKVSSETRIPEGIYDITVRSWGGFDSRYSKRFGKWHKGMLWIRNVPGFEYILIHIGNTDQDTAGCLLVGDGVSGSVTGEIRLTNSTAAYQKLYDLVIDNASLRNLSIEFIDSEANIENHESLKEKIIQA